MLCGDIPWENVEISLLLDFQLESSRNEIEISTFNHISFIINECNTTSPHNIIILTYYYHMTIWHLHFTTSKYKVGECNSTHSSHLLLNSSTCLHTEYPWRGIVHQDFEDRIINKHQFCNYCKFHWRYMEKVHNNCAPFLCEYCGLELWVNFDHKYCFWAYSLELALIFLMLVQFPSVCLLLYYVMLVQFPFICLLLVFVTDRRTEKYRGGYGWRTNSQTDRYTHN